MMLVFVSLRFGLRLVAWLPFPITVFGYYYYFYTGNIDSRGQKQNKH